MTAPTTFPAGAPPCAVTSMGAAVGRECPHYLPEPASTLVRRGNYPGAVLPRIGGFFPHSDTGLSSPCLPIRARRDCAAAGRFLSAATSRRFWIGLYRSSAPLRIVHGGLISRAALNLILGSQPKPDRGSSGDRRGETRTTPHSGGPSTCHLLGNRVGQTWHMMRRMGHPSAALRDAVKAQAPTVPAHLLATKLRPLDQHPQTYAVLKGAATAFATGVSGGGYHSPVPVHITGAA